MTTQGTTRACDIIKPRVWWRYSYAGNLHYRILDTFEGNLAFKGHLEQLGAADITIRLGNLAGADSAASITNCTIDGEPWASRRTIIRTLATYFGVNVEDCWDLIDNMPLSELATAMQEYYLAHN